MKTLLLLISLFAMQQTKAQKIFSVDYESQADVKVFVVKYESQAEVKIFFVEYESQAGWKNNQKKHFFY